MPRERERERDLPNERTSTIEIEDFSYFFVGVNSKYFVSTAQQKEILKLKKCNTKDCWK